MEHLRALGFAHGGSQVLASSLHSSLLAKGICRSLQLGYCLRSYSLDPSTRLPSLISRKESSLGKNRQSGFKHGRWRKGQVECSESSITETSTQAEIEVVNSLKEAENQSSRAVSGDNVRSEGDSEVVINEVDDHVQAALEEILSEDTVLESPENTLLRSFEHDDVMEAATKVAEALVETDDEPFVSFPLLEPLSPMGAAAVTIWPVEVETTEELAQEEVQSEEVGFMVQTEEPEHFDAPLEAAILEDTVAEEAVEEEHLLEPGAVATALMVQEVADALKVTEEDAVSHMIEKETEVERLQGAEEKSLIEQLKDIFVFAGPALGIWLSGPIMGIIDTAVIGQSSSLELAALGPGTVLCDQVCYVFMFLSVATSNLVATSLAHKNKEEAAHHLSRMLFLAVACGFGLLVVTEVWVNELLQAFVGPQNYDLIPAARIYVQIRALAWPAVLVSLVSQSASLAMMDSKNPLKVLVIGSLFNLVGDVVLCSFLGYGIAGAAWATIVAQYVAGILMALSLSDKGYSALNIQVPSFKDLVYITRISGPLLLTMISKVSFYTLMTYLATSLGAITVAAHQVMVGIYGLCCVWGEPLAQTAQSFMPPLLYGSHKNLEQARRLLKQLLIIGVVVGTAVGGLAIAIPWVCPRIFTTDTAIISQMRDVTLPFLVGMISCPPSLSLEGTLLAGRDFGYLSFSMTTCFIGGTALLLACKVLGWGLAGTWWTLAAFQWARFFMTFARLYSPSSVLAETGSDTALKPKTT
ncbi:protein DETOXIFICATION 46, chloroplastic isoform X2 [Physcomitrium patens]|uniref:Protein DETOXIFICATION n=2 Tax=Physcomitrium patens TaxID=3218 RepID=A0A2K1KVD9_PHYPA|nr:protein DETOXIFICATION 46, chloroplastic-like isoform X2 [Physcomitrium patens]XP_024371605.1 protein DETOXIFICATION 46, chloroplastic-like isoform X2 [Physcomitrium patens]PNR57749.1 hypothetical protein PHYPA_004743 [Physcomitrium patens]|eukprot:XP_024371604.1 protein DETOXIFICATION 46, chloroplastic-like isoform X2 [Physcomitrella patens]